MRLQKSFFYLLFLGLLLCHVAPNSWAAHYTLTYQLTGLPKSLKKNVLTQLKTEQAALGSLHETSQIKTLYQGSEINIRKALQVWGYFKAHIQTCLHQHGNHWLITAQIEPQAPVIITHLDLKLSGSGANDPALTHFIAHFPLSAGQILATPDYEKTKQTFLTLAEQQGYLMARFVKHRIDVNIAKNSATVSLHLDTGSRYYFGRVSFVPNPLSPAFLSRFLTFQPGQPYSSNKALHFQDAMNNSNYFQTVSVVPDLNHRNQQNEIPIHVLLTPRHQHQYSFGAGYGTDTGVRGSFGWDSRYITSTGHHFSTLLRLSQIQNSAQAVYTIPGKHPLSDQSNINASLLRTDYPSAISMMQKVGIANIKTEGNWHRTLALHYQQEHDTFDNGNLASINSKLLIPSLNWQYLKKEGTAYITNGHRFDFTLQGAERYLLSDTRLLQTEISDKYIHSLSSKSRVILRGNFGYTTVHDCQNQLPLSMSFFAGGAQSVRGYSYQALGPGRYVLVGSIEVQHQLVGHLNGALFYDIGNAFNNFPSPFQHSVSAATTDLIRSLQRGAGVGLVFASPIGMINLSLAKALSLPGKPMRIQFSMGADL